MAARRAGMVAAHLHPAGAQELWEARPAQNTSSQMPSQMSVMPPTPPWRTADVDSYPPMPPQQLGGGGGIPGGRSLRGVPAAGGGVGERCGGGGRE